MIFVTRMSDAPSGEGSSDPTRNVEKDAGRVVAVVVGVDRPDGIRGLCDHFNDRSEMLWASLQKH